MAAHLTFKQRESFARRLKESLEKIGLNPNSATQLKKKFCEHSQGATVDKSTAYKWLAGDALPDGQNMEIVADLCHVCPYWLRTGIHKNDADTARGISELKCSNRDLI
jgi:hypothetical protein